MSSSLESIMMLALPPEPASFALTTCHVIGATRVTRTQSSGASRAPTSPLLMPPQYLMTRPRVAACAPVRGGGGRQARPIPSRRRALIGRGRAVTPQEQCADDDGQDVALAAWRAVGLPECAP